MIGDPTDKNAARKKMTKEQARKNAEDYTQQVEKTLKFTGPNAAKVMFNSEWLSKLSFEKIAELASNFTVQQLLERDFFQDRLKKNKPIHLHEFLYPLMQGYDCVAMDVDLEIGGSDQLFNMLAGRNLMKALKKKDKHVLTMKLLTDPSGEKMGKSEGNAISVNSAPGEMFGQLMALPDNMLDLAIELLTDIPMKSVKELKPLELKKKMAFDVVKQLHGDTEANEAQKKFKQTFQEKKPDFETTTVNSSILLEIVSEFLESKSEAKRKIMEGAIDVNGKAETNPLRTLENGAEVKIGKKIFIKVKLVDDN